MGALFGAILGFFIFRSIFGIFLGAFLGQLFLNPNRGRGYGHYSFFGGFSREQLQKLQNMYFYTFFTLLGKMAKADGSLSKKEGDYLLDLLRRLNLTGEMKTNAINHFNNAKHETKSIRELAQQFHLLCQNSVQVERQLLYQIVGMASADGVITRQEENIIEEIADVFGINEEELSHILSSFEASTDRSYHILGVSRDSSNEEIKRNYKKLIKECHPDMLKSKGLPQSMVDEAKKRFYEIQHAWESIKKEKNIS